MLRKATIFILRKPSKPFKNLIVTVLSNGNLRHGSAGLTLSLVKVDNQTVVNLSHRRTPQLTT